MNKLCLKKPDFLIVIVNWNTKDMLENCLNSIMPMHEEIDFEVLIVDNGSSDGSTKMLKQNFSHCHLIENSDNMGFSKANNQGIKKYPNFPFYLLLNSDTVVNIEAIKEMLTVAKNNPNTAAINPALVLPSGELQLGCAGYGPNFIHSFNTFFGLSRISHLFKGLYFFQKQHISRKKPVSVNWVALACTIISSEAIKDVGLLDESYFVYGEDSDWCWKAKNNNWSIQYIPYVSIRHYVGASSKNKAQLTSNWFESLARSIQKQGSVLDYYFFLIFGLVGYFFRFLILLFWNFISLNKEHNSKKLSLLCLKTCFKLLFKK